MVFGLVLKLINLILQKDYKQIFLSWAPSFIFLVNFFGFMVFCIIYKFFVNWPGTPDRLDDLP